MYQAHANYVKSEVEDQVRSAATGDHDAVRELADLAIDALGFELAPDSEGYAKLCDLLNTSGLVELREQHRRYMGDLEGGQLALHFDVSAKLLGGKASSSTPRRSVITVPVIEAKVLEVPQEPSRIVDEAWLRRLCNRPAGLAILPIAGEAMQPTLQNGDEVIIQRLRTHDSLHDGLYAVRGSSETFVRRIALDPTKNRISVLTDHPAYPSWPGVQRKAINVVGRVIWIGSQGRESELCCLRHTASWEVNTHGSMYVELLAAIKFLLIAKVPRWGYDRGYFW